jgi:hypothetical protein
MDFFNTLVDLQDYGFNVHEFSPCEWSQDLMVI